MFALIGTNLGRRPKQKGTVVPLGILLQEHSTLIGFGCLFLLGVAVGAAVIPWLEVSTTQKLTEILSVFLQERYRQTMADTFLSSFLPNLGLLALLTLCGFCAISLPIIVAIPLFRGMGFGLMASAMLIVYQMRAIGCICILLLPNLIWSVVLLFFACRDAMRLSISLRTVIRPGAQRMQTPVNPGGFCAKIMLYSMLMALGSVGEAALFRFFAHIFLPG